MFFFLRLLLVENFLFLHGPVQELASEKNLLAQQLKEESGCRRLVELELTSLRQAHAELKVETARTHAELKAETLSASTMAKTWKGALDTAMRDFDVMKQRDVSISKERDDLREVVHKLEIKYTEMKKAYKQTVLDHAAHVKQYERVPDELNQLRSDLQKLFSEFDASALATEIERALSSSERGAIGSRPVSPLKLSRTQNEFSPASDSIAVWEVRLKAWQAKCGELQESLDEAQATHSQELQKHDSFVRTLQQEVLVLGQRSAEQREHIADLHKNLALEREKLQNSEDLRSKLKKKAEEAVVHLRKLNKDLKDKYDKAEADWNKRFEDIHLNSSQLTKEHAQSNSAMHGLVSIVAPLQQENEILTERVQVLCQEMKALREASVSFESEREALYSVLAKSQAEIDRLTSAADCSSQLASQVNSLLAEKAQLEEKMQVLNKAKISADTELASTSLKLAMQWDGASGMPENAIDIMAQPDRVKQSKLDLENKYQEIKKEHSEAERDLLNVSLRLAFEMEQRAKAEAELSLLKERILEMSDKKTKLAIGGSGSTLWSKAGASPETSGRWPDDQETRTKLKLQAGR